MGNVCCIAAEFGTVLELRINSGGKLPNFGFVVFDDSEPVQKILSSRVRLDIDLCDLIWKQLLV